MADIKEEIKEDLQAQGMTTDQILDAVNTAILKASQVSSYKIGSRSVNYQNITELRKLRAELMQEVALNQNNSRLFANTSVCEFEGR